MTDAVRAAPPATSDAPATVSGGPSFGHLPVLDGLRALAVVPVVLFHIWGRFRGGFIGVDLFFVISGFLITSILVRERDRTGRIDLRGFWGRRVRRLVPAVVLLVAVCAIAAAALGLGTALGFADSVGALTWSQNWVHLWATGTRWGAAAAHQSLIDHLWSLAVEEQFYLVWPLVLLAVCRRLPKRGARIAVVVALAAASAFAMAAVDPGVAYFRSDARAFELLGGAVLALSGWRPRQTTATVLAAFGIAATIAFVLLGSPLDAWMYPWGFLVATATFSGLVAAAAAPPPWMSTVFSRPLQSVGRVSYGIYLWHVPVIRILTPARTHLPTIPLAALRLAVLAAVVIGSYRLVETPVRSRSWGLTLPRVAVASVLVIAALVPLGLDARHDLDHQYDATTSPPAVAAGATRVLVVGDGVATTIARSFPPASTWDVSRWQCGLLPGGVRQRGRVVHLDEACDHWRERWGHAVDRFRPDVVVVASSTWDLFQRGDGRWRVDDADRRTYREAADLLGRRGARVVWVEPAYTASMAPVSIAERTRRMTRMAALAAVVESLPGVRVEPVVPSGESRPGPVLPAHDVEAVGARLAAELTG